MGTPAGEEHEGLLRRRLGLDAWEPLPGSILRIDDGQSTGEGEGEGDLGRSQQGIVIVAVVGGSRN